MNLELLKCDLATRRNNEHIGSGLGGNTTHFLYSLTHELDLKATTLADARVELAQLIESDASHITCEDQDLINEDFLSKIPSTTQDIKHLKNGVALLNRVVPLFSEIEPQAKSIESEYDKEMKQLFKNVKCDPSRIDLDPYYGPIYRKILDKRCDDIKNIVGDNIINLIADMGKLPTYIFLFIMRVGLGIRNIVFYSLDESPQLSDLFYNVNNVLKEIS